MNTELFKGVSVETGKEVTGYLVRCEGQVDKGQTFICPEVMSAHYSGIGHGETHFCLGPFIRVHPHTVEPAPVSREKNTKFSFLYRDASNYKTYNEFILSGTLTPDEIDEIVACACGDNFIAEQVGLSHDLPGELNDDDHCWCELYYESNHGFETTDESPTTDLTAQQLLENFRNAKGNWDEVKYAPENIF